MLCFRRTNRNTMFSYYFQCEYTEMDRKYLIFIVLILQNKSKKKLNTEMRSTYENKTKQSLIIERYFKVRTVSGVCICIWMYHAVKCTATETNWNLKRLGKESHLCMWNIYSINYRQHIHIHKTLQTTKMTWEIKFWRKKN